MCLNEAQPCPRGHGSASILHAVLQSPFRSVFAKQPCSPAWPKADGCCGSAGVLRSEALLKMAASAGVLRSEALLTARAAHFVCFPGTGHADRIITARATEYAHGLVLLRLCRSMRPVDRGTLQAACATARASLRAGASEEEVLAQARASGLLRDQGAAAAEAPAVLAGAEDKAVDASASLGGPYAPAACAPRAIALRSSSTHTAAAFERGRSWPPRSSAGARSCSGRAAPRTA